MAKSSGSPEQILERCPTCSDLADQDDARGRNFPGSHPINHKSLQKALCARRWRLQPCGHFTCCPEAATISCEKCKLVQYCSLECQQMHQESHRKLCESHLLQKETTPFDRRKDPNLLPNTPSKHFAHLPTLSNPSLPVYGLLGNADDRYKWLLSQDSSSEMLAYFLPYPYSCPELPDHLRFLFPCAYDLRNVLQTICEVPDDYTGRITMFINSAKSILAVRDVLILELLRSYGSDGMDIAIALWYSTALTPQQDKTMILAINRILYYGSNYSQYGEEDLKLGAESICRYQSSFLSSRMDSFMQADLTSDPTGILVGMLMDFNARFEPSTQYWERDEEMDDIENVKRMCALPAHLASWNRYHTRGILLPFDTMDDQFTIPNRVRYSRSMKFITRYSKDVLSGWDIPKIISSGVHCGASDEDLYGCLFFHLRKMMQTFLQKLNNCSIELYLTQFGARELAEILKEADICFHRIDACSLAHDDAIDSNYSISLSEIHALSKKLSLLGKKPIQWTLPHTLQILGRLLEKNACTTFPSRLLTVVLDWANKDPSALDILQKEESFIKSRQEDYRRTYDKLHGLQIANWVYSARITPDHNEQILMMIDAFAEARAFICTSEIANHLQHEHFMPYLRNLVAKEMEELRLTPRVPSMILPRDSGSMIIWRSFLEYAKAPGLDDADHSLNAIVKRENPRQLYYTALFGGLTFLEEFQEWGWEDEELYTEVTSDTNNPSSSSKAMAL